MTMMKHATGPWGASLLVTALWVLIPPAISAQAGEQGAPGEAAPPPGFVDVEAAPRPEAHAVRATGAIQVDGHLDEDDWDRATVLTGFVQSQPDRGFPATQETVVRVLYDDDHIYFGIENYDDRPEELVVTTLERDFGGRSTREFDVVAISLDTFLDRRNAFMFHVNPAGAVRDAQVFDDSRNQNAAWRGAWEAATSVSDSGWVAEVAIPLSTLRFDPEREIQDWGLNIMRRTRRLNEDSYWAPLDRRDPVHRMSKAGTLRGLEGLQGGRDLRVKPYLATGHAEGVGVDEVELGGSVKAGGDLKWGLTPQLTLDLTVNTDFSQVEVDQERVNLSRFSLFFPEQRDFFVENSGSFSFGDQSDRGLRSGSSLRDFTLFHSRAIGLSDAGTPLPMLGGARLTGRTGPYEVGLLNMQTRQAEGGEPENFSVARLRRSVGEGSDFGFLVANRQATGSDRDGGYNRSFGADANLRLLGNLIVNAYIAGTDEAGGGDDNRAGRVAVGWRDTFLNTSAFVRHIGADFNPGIGFVRRPGSRHHYGTLGVHPRPDWPYIQELGPYLEVHYITDPSSTLETRTQTLGVDVDFLDGGSLGLRASDRFERLHEPFRIQSGASVAPGDYSFREVSATYQTSGARSLSGRLQLTGGDFFNGSRRSAAVSGDWQPDPRLALNGSVDVNYVSLPDTPSFTADVFGARVRYAHSTRSFASAGVQYNSATEELVTSLRTNFIHAPLSDLFLVFTERRNLDAGTTLERIVSLKVTRTVPF